MAAPMSQVMRDSIRIALRTETDYGIIADRYGISRRAVQAIARAAGMSPRRSDRKVGDGGSRKKIITPELRAAIVAGYAHQKDREKLAKQLGISLSRVQDVLAEELGII